jgi:putative iron-regulated protein
MPLTIPVKANTARRLVLIALSVVMIAGCTRAPQDDPRRAVVETYAQLVLTSYEDALRSARELDRAIDAFLEKPSERRLERARDRWKEARVTYGRTEAFRFYGGPIDREGGPEGRINGWPLDENHIDAVAVDRYNAAPGLNIIGSPQRFPQITPDVIAEQNESGGEKNIASGYHAIEFLLWGQDFNDPPESAGQRPYTDYVPKSKSPNDIARRRGQYLKAASTLLIRDLESVIQQWRVPAEGEPPNYRAKLVAGDVYTGLKHMLTGIITLSEVEMAGERMSVPLLSGDQEEEQSCFSDFSLQDLRANAEGIEAVYYGTYTKSAAHADENSLAALVKAADPRVAEEVDARIQRVREALDAVRTPFDREIQPDNPEGRARVQGAIDALRAEAQSFARAAKSLQIFLSPIESDGD